jgi:hypothetical protein
VTCGLQSASSFSLLTSYMEAQFFTSLSSRANHTLPFFFPESICGGPTIRRRLLFVQLPDAYSSARCAQGSSPMIRSMDSNLVFRGSSFLYNIACVVDDHMVFICLSIVERRSIWFLSFCLLRLCNLSNRLKSYTDGSSPVLCTGVLCCL